MPPNAADVDQIIAMKAVGMSPEYVNALRAFRRAFARLDADDFAGMKAIGVTPDYTRDLVAAGFRNSMRTN